MVALLVVGQAMIGTGALESLARLLVWLSSGRFWRAIALGLGGVTAMSGFLNNTPLVVMFIPIMRSIAERYGQSASTVMMPLSFAAILGGMLTLIGTSTNLLVSGELAKLGAQPLQFFDFTIPGLALALVGGAYVLLLPRLLPERDPPGLVTDQGKQFIAELDIAPGSPMIGDRSQSGLFPKLADVTVRLVQRGERSFLPPFEDVELEEGDILIVAATRKVLTEMLAAKPRPSPHNPARRRGRPGARPERADARRGHGASRLAHGRADAGLHQFHRAQPVPRAGGAEAGAHAAPAPFGAAPGAG